MASFQTNIVWKRPRKRENKNYRFVSFLPDALQKILKKKEKNYEKKKKNNYGFITSQNQLKEDEKEKLQFCSVNTRRVIENFKKIAKKFIKLKNTIIASFKARIG